MKDNKTKIAIFIILVIALVAFVFISKKSEAPTVIQQTPTTIPAQTPEITNQPPTTNNQTVSDDIIVDSPINNQVLSSGTLKVSGKARGSWYFEASAPFEIEDSNKNVIETSAIRSIGDWMTSDFVPFEGEVTFTVPKGVKSGFVVFKNDNPSGDPSRDKSVSVPITFK
jgi:hypothetical protein